MSSIVGTLPRRLRLIPYFVARGCRASFPHDHSPELSSRQTKHHRLNETEMGHSLWRLRPAVEQPLAASRSNCKRASVRHTEVRKIASSGAEVGQSDCTKPIRSEASVATPMQIGRFDAHFPKNWSENQRKLRRRDRANSERAA